MSNISIYKEIEATVRLDINDIEHFIGQCSDKEKHRIIKTIETGNYIGGVCADDTFMNYNGIPDQIKKMFNKLPSIVRDNLLKELNEQYG